MAVKQKKETLWLYSEIFIRYVLIVHCEQFVKGFLSKRPHSEEQKAVVKFNCPELVLPSFTVPIVKTVLKIFYLNAV